MSNQQITQANPRKYFTMLPNLIDELDLDVYEFRLLVHYYRVGNCWEGTRTTAKRCRVSIGTVVKKRRSLADKGLIDLVEPDDSSATIAVIVRDIWAENMRHYGCSPDEQGCSPDEQGCSPDERGCSPGDTKEYYIKNNPNKKKSSAGAASGVTGTVGEDGAVKPYSVYEALLGVEPGLNKGQTLREAKIMLNGGSGINPPATLDEIVDCAQYLKTTPFYAKQAPVDASAVRKNIMRWRKGGKPRRSKQANGRQEYSYEFDPLDGVEVFK